MVTHMVTHTHTHPVSVVALFSCEGPSGGRLMLVQIMEHLLTKNLAIDLETFDRMSITAVLVMIQTQEVLI